MSRIQVRKKQLAGVAVITGNDNLYYTGTPGATYNPAVGLGVPNLTQVASILG
jgi:hypothetical protein